MGYVPREGWAGVRSLQRLVDVVRRRCYGADVPAGDEVRRAEVLIECRRPQEAVAVLVPYVASAPDDVAGWVVLARAQAGAGQPWRAWEAARRAVSVGPGEADAHAVSGWIQLDLGRPEEAVEAFRTAIRIRPGVPGLHVGLGAALVRDRLYDSALAAFGEALRLDPGSAPAHQGRSVALSRLERHREARQAIEQALRLDPQMAAAHNSAAVEALRRGRLGAAGRSLGRALRADPQDPFARANVDVLVMRYGRFLTLTGMTAFLVALASSGDESSPGEAGRLPWRVGVAAIAVLAGVTAWRLGSAPRWLRRFAVSHWREPALSIDVACGAVLYAAAVAVVCLPAPARDDVTVVGWIVFVAWGLVSPDLRRKYARRRGSG
jgi:Flp pilus assembly protein TadD